jgi:hypothetical protein
MRVWLYVSEQLSVCDHWITLVECMHGRSMLLKQLENYGIMVYSYIKVYIWRIST